MYAVTLWMSALTALAGARVYDRCELARDLQLLGVDRDHIATWVCIAYHESRFDTAAQNYGSGDHGLLQISELYWCGPGKACGAPCSAFRDEDISDDVKCALQIHKEHTRLQGDGFLAWVVYPNYCKRNAKKFIIDCDKNAKNFPVKFENKARYLKPADLTPESKTRTVSVPYRNTQSPRYLAISSIFQGSYVDEFERNYYDNNKQSNWLYFKVDNIDDLKLPGTDVVRSRFTEVTIRPSTKMPLDPALKGIKPPSPKKIESNQFRRRKTFTEPLFLRNRIADDQKIIRTTPVPARSETDTRFSFKEDLSHNIFLNLSPSIISKSLREFSPQEKKSNDFSRFHVKTPRVESSSPNSILTYDELSQNPFLNSLPGFNFKSRTESPFLVTDSSQNVRYTITSPSPVSLMKSSKQINSLRYPEQDSKIQKDGDIKVSIEDLTKNPFLSDLLRANIEKLPSESQQPLNRDENLRRNITLTTLKPTTASVFPFTRQEDIKSSYVRLETSTKKPTDSVQRGQSRYLSDFDINTTDKPATERSTTVSYSTRKYKTISRQRSNTKTDDLKRTTPIGQNIEKSDGTSTARPTENTYRRQLKIETTTSKTTTLYKETKSKYVVGLINASIPQTISKPLKPSIQQTTLAPETANSVRRIQTTSRPQIKNSIKTTSTTLTSRPQTTSGPEIMSRSPTPSGPEQPSRQQKSQRPEPVETKSRIRLQTTSRPQTTSRSETMSVQPTKSNPGKPIIQQMTQRSETVKINFTSRPQTTGPEITSIQTNRTEKPIRQQATNRPETAKTNSVSRLQTTSRPQTTSRTETTIGPPTTRRPQITSRTKTTNKPETYRAQTTSNATKIRPHTYSNPWITNTPRTTSPTTTLSRSINRFGEGSRTYTTTTRQPSFSWRKYTNSTSSSTTVYLTTQKPTVVSTTEASTGRTTQSIFDLYLKPSTRPSFKPFEFTKSINSPSKISIFSDGTTKPHPDYFTTKKPIA